MQLVIRKKGVSQLGANAVEYALVLAVITTMVMAGAKLMTPNLQATFTNAGQSILDLVGSSGGSSDSSSSDDSNTDSSNRPPDNEVAIAPAALVPVILQASRAVVTWAARRIATVGAASTRLLRSQIDDLAKAGKILDRNGMTKAGRALQKHGSDRGNPNWPKPGNKASEKNKQGQEILEDILNSKNQKITRNQNPYDGVDIYDLKTGRGARYNSNGELVGFLNY